MNFGDLAQQLGLEEGEYLIILQDFLEAGDSDLAVLQAELDGGDIQQLAEAAHSIKGAAINFGFTEISNVAREVERNARRGILQGSHEAAQALQRMFADITVALLKRQN